MNDNKTSGRCPHHAPVRFRESASQVTKPLHDVARLDGDFGNALLYL
jgi:hypothetical protein